jgi:Na+/melibiose symporter-like transporter
MIKNITIRGNEYAVLNQEGGEKPNLIKSFGTFMKNRPAVGCTIAAMGMFLGMQSASTANTIMFATHFGNASLSGLVMMVGFLPMFIFMPFATKLVKKYGKKEVAGIGSIAGLRRCYTPYIPSLPQGHSAPRLYGRSYFLRTWHGLL